MSTDAAGALRDKPARDRPGAHPPDLPRLPRRRRLLRVQNATDPITAPILRLAGNCAIPSRRRLRRLRGVSLRRSGAGRRFGRRSSSRSRSKGCSTRSRIRRARPTSSAALRRSGTRAGPWRRPHVSAAAWGSRRRAGGRTAAAARRRMRCKVSSSGRPRRWAPDLRGACSLRPPFAVMPSSRIWIFAHQRYGVVADMPRRTPHLARPSR